LAKPNDIPDTVRRLIGEHLESVAQLEVLLLVRAAPEKWWTPDEVARALVTRPPAALGFLAHLHGTGLLDRDGEGFRYAPPGRTGAVVDELAACYATRRPTVVGLILAGPDEAISSLADAFLIRRRKD
jgi:DNA-binding IclR family transcriptional regulator